LTDDPTLHNPIQLVETWFPSNSGLDRSGVEQCSRQLDSLGGNRIDLPVHIHWESTVDQKKPLAGESYNVKEMASMISITKI
jgi:hypothetical protein